MTTAATTTGAVGDKRTPLFAGVKVWFSPNLLIADLSLRDELVRRGASVVEQAGNDVNTNTNNNNTSNKQMILHIVASASDSVCTQASMRNNKLATVHYIRALIEHDTNASNSPLALPIEWNGNVLASLAMRGIVVCCTGMAPAEKTVGMRLFFCFLRGLCSNDEFFCSGCTALSLRSAAPWRALWMIPLRTWWRRVSRTKDIEFIIYFNALLVKKNKVRIL
jgi:hypothetical protein